MKKILLLVLVIFAIVILVGCHDDNEPIDIYTSIYPVEYITKQIVKEKYTVKSIYPRGKDVHDFEPSLKDILNMAKSKIIFYIGLGLEPLIEVAKESTLSKIPTIPLSTNLTLVESDGGHTHNPEENHEHENESMFYDTHVWLDPDKMRTMTNTVLENLIKYLDLTEQEVQTFTENAINLKDEFNKLDQEFFGVVYDESIANLTIMVDHDAYAYWEVRYGIERIRLRNDNESSDIIPLEMAEKINLAKEKNIRYICVTKNEIESPIIDQYLKQLDLTNDAKVQLHNLATISKIEEEQGLDYFSLMRDNLEILKMILPKK